MPLTEPGDQNSLFFLSKCRLFTHAACSDAGHFSGRLPATASSFPACHPHSDRWLQNLKLTFKAKARWRKKEKGKEKWKNASASAIHAYCHGHRTCRRPCRAAAYAHRLFLALIYLPAKQPFVINLSRLTCIQFPCTDYSPWWVKMNRHRFSFSFSGGMCASLFCFRSSRRLFLCTWKFPSKTKDPSGAVTLSTPAACTVLRGRRTDRLLWSLVSHDGGGKSTPLFASAPGNAEIPAHCAPLGGQITGTTSNASRSTLETNSCTTMGGKNAITWI